MKKKYLLLSIFLIAALATITTTKVNSKVTSPPAGNAGDPNSGVQWLPVIESGTTCAYSGCHPGPAQLATSTDLTLNIGTGNPTTTLDNTFTYVPGTTYNIAFLINQFVSPNPYYGFQIAAIDGLNNQAGTMGVSNATTTKINPLSGIEYMGHLVASAIKSWTFKWTAPTTFTGPVTFYYAFNAASASIVPPDDMIPEGTVYKGSVTIQEGTSGINDISTKISSLNIFPNPVSNEFSISFDLKETNTVSSQLYSLDGKLCKQLLNEKISEGAFSRSFNISNMPSGIYLVKLNVNNSTVSKKIIKQ